MTSLSISDVKHDRDGNVFIFVKINNVTSMVNISFNELGNQSTVGILDLFIGRMKVLIKNMARDAVL